MKFLRKLKSYFVIRFYLTFHENKDTLLLLREWASLELNSLNFLLKDNDISKYSLEYLNGQAASLNKLLNKIKELE